MAKQWSDIAMNKTFRAIRGAFSQARFPKIRDFFCVSEPEACAHYTFQMAQLKGAANFRNVSTTELGL
jgi:hypothetical protein